MNLWEYGFTIVDNEGQIVETTMGRVDESERADKQAEQDAANRDEKAREESGRRTVTMWWLRMVPRTRRIMTRWSDR